MMLLGLIILLGLTIWALSKIIAKTRRNEGTSTVHRAALFMGLIGIDLLRVLEGFSARITDSSDIIPFVMCSLLLVVCPPAALAIYRYLVVRPSSCQPQMTSTTPQHSLLRSIANARITRVCVPLVTVLLLVALYSADLLVGAVYTYGISALPDNKSPSGLTLPALAVQADWLAYYGSGPRVMEPWSITDTIRLCLILYHGGWKFPLGNHLASRGAHFLLKREPAQNQHKNRVLWHLRNTVIAMWVSRNWTPDQAIRTELAESYYGREFYGFAEASRGYFGCLPNELTVKEIALLVGLTSPGSLDRANERLRFVLSRLAHNHVTNEALPSPTLPSRFNPTPRGGCKTVSEDKGMRALMEYLSWGYLHNAKYIIENGAGANAKDRLCRTALMQASCHGYQDIVALLLDKGADVTARNDFGWTALMAASYSGKLACVKLLLNKGADVNVKDKWGETARLLAASNGHSQIVELLKAHGAKE